VTDRYTVNTITSDALDQLYDQLDRAREAAAWIRHNYPALTHANDRLTAALDQPPPGPTATPTTGPATWLHEGSRDLSIPRQHRFTVRPADPAEERAASHRARRIAEEAVHASEQLNVLRAPHIGLVVEPYRDDRNRPRWVFRCWGTDACDGALSLDHYNEQSAQRARDRHIGEDHATPAPTATQATEPQEQS
jgi:hypothetical protein